MLEVLKGRELNIWTGRILTDVSFQYIYIVSPFITDIYIDGRNRFSSMLMRLAKSAHVYLLTRPPRDTTEMRFLEGLKEGGISIYVNSLLHAKLILAKRSQTSGLAIIGSANLTYSGFWKNLEIALLVDEPHVIGRLNEEVERLIALSRIY